MRGKLFLICPDCHMEAAISNHFDGELFFITALGSVFNVSGKEHVDSIVDFLTYTKVHDIYIVNDCSCRFIQSTLLSNKGYGTKAEDVLQELFSFYPLEILAEKDMEKRAFRLAEFNLKRQAQTLKEAEFIGCKLEDHALELKGLIYEKDRFAEISLD